jgi:hypothetical protein
LTKKLGNFLETLSLLTKQIRKILETLSLLTKQIRKILEDFPIVKIDKVAKFLEISISE